MFLAREIGAELVEGQDLVVRNGYVYMRTTDGLQQVDVIYRRVDDDFLDPLVFRPDSLLGVRGLIDAAQLGNVTLANAPGTGRRRRQERLRLRSRHDSLLLGRRAAAPERETYLCRRPEDLEYVLDNLDSLVVKRVGESGGYGMIIGPHATQEERDEYAKGLRADPAGFVAQPVLAPLPRSLPDRRGLRAAPR